MGVRDIVSIVTDGGTDVQADNVHHECRQCGRNLTADSEECPDCGGQVSTYDLG